MLLLCFIFTSCDLSTSGGFLIKSDNELSSKISTNSAEDDIVITNGDSVKIYINQSLKLNVANSTEEKIDYESTNFSGASVDQDGTITGLSKGQCIIKAKVLDKLDSVVVYVYDDSADLYVNVDKDEFYNNYISASSYIDSYYRSKHFLMSGTISDQDQKPSISSNQPKNDENTYYKNQTMSFLDDCNTYVVYDSYGSEKIKVYKGGLI